MKHAYYAVRTSAGRGASSFPVVQAVVVLRCDSRAQPSDYPATPAYPKMPLAAVSPSTIAHLVETVVHRIEHIESMVFRFH